MRDFAYKRNANDVSRNLMTWYMQSKRELPWRQTQDPYSIWVSEVMLQQTRVETVIPYWNRFVEQFPSLHALAEADEQTVLKLWEGLGYYSRARNLQAAVREVAASYGGVVPKTAAEFSKLPGVGPYTAGAVLSIAYNEALPAVDGNVFRVLSRIFLIQEDISKPKTRALFEGLAVSLIPPGIAGDFNQALMELGAVVCMPKNPNCTECPVQQQCMAFAEGMQRELPVKGKKSAPRLSPMYAVLLQRPDGKWAMRKRPDTGLLAKMWEFPTWSQHELSLEDYVEQLGITHKQVEKLQPVAQVDHIFSHLHWQVSVWMGQLIDNTAGDSDQQLIWLSTEEMEEKSLAAVHNKMKLLIKQREGGGASD
ncbi:MAG: A/G-specific adenine glycosylase [Bacilli bacterium]|nr:A/G-specific adenine glycosylase [Bacilli bacterium]